MHYMQHSNNNNQQVPIKPHRCVLLVDCDKQCYCHRHHQSVWSIVETLEFYSYKVTIEPCASQALLRLEKEMESFDIVMANFDSYDGQAFKLLRAAVNLGLPTILMTDHEDYDDMLARLALEEGAFICLEKPISRGTIKALWKYILREKSRRFRDQISTNNSLMINGKEPSIIVNNFVIESRNSRKRKRSQEVFNNNVESRNNQFQLLSPKNNDTTGEERTIWTEELHNIFMDAVLKLGEGRCFPKEILEAMNVPNLTRMQVASHLQKCRNNSWQGPNKKTKKYTESSDNKRHTLRFGAMPPPVTEPGNTNWSNLNVDDYLVDDLSQLPFYVQ